MFSFLAKGRGSIDSQWIDEAYLVCLLAGYGGSLLILNLFDKFELSLLNAVLLGESLCLVLFLLCGFVISISRQSKNDS